MPAAQSTVLRLERRIQEENARSLSALHQAYEALAGAILNAARERGYGGGDPLGAIGHLVAPAALDREVGRAAADLWLVFFGCFRSDEASFELPRFRERADALNQRLGRLPPGEGPDAGLARDLLAALGEMWQERHDAISQRLDQLIGDLGQHQAKLGSVELAGAHVSDEMTRVRQVLAAVQGEGAAGSPDEPLGIQIGKVLETWRGRLKDAERRRAEAIEALGAFVRAVAAVSGGAAPPALPGSAAQSLGQVQRIEAARRDAESQSRSLRAQVGQLEAERRQLMEELAGTQARLEAQERGEANPEERLRLYREAFEAMEAGRDHKALVEKVRSIERVISLPAADAERTVKALDRELAGLAAALVELRSVAELVEDPRRYRPRMFASKYEFKTVPGQLLALRDAGRDVLVYADRARWAAGVQSLARQVPRLRAVFTELVRLVGAWKSKLGDPPAVSLSISLDAGSGILALPAIVAADLESVLKRKAKAAPALNDLAPLIEDCVAMLHAAVLEARGEAPERVEAPKRESQAQAVARLAAELTSLAAICETAFSEALRDDFRLGHADAALLADDRLLKSAVQRMDAACEAAGEMPGAPPRKLAELPARREPGALLAAARGRAEWLALCARHRVVLAG